MKLFILIPLILLYFLQCGNMIIDTISGKFLSNPPPLVFSKVAVKSANLVEATFKQEIIPESITGAEDFTLQDSSGNPLAVTSVSQNDEDLRVIYVSTGTQVTGELYRLTVFNLHGADGMVATN